MAAETSDGSPGREPHPNRTPYRADADGAPVMRITDEDLDAERIVGPASAAGSSLPSQTPSRPTGQGPALRITDSDLVEDQTLRPTPLRRAAGPRAPARSYSQMPAIPAASRGQEPATHRRERPAGVTVLAVLQIIGGIGSMGMGGLLIIGSLGMAASTDIPLVGAFGTAGGVIAAGIGVLGLLLGIGLLRLRNWARVTAMALCSLSYVSLALSLRFASLCPQGMIGPVIGCLIATIIIAYLRSRNVKAAFGI